MSRAKYPFNAFLNYPEVPVFNAESGPLSGLKLAVKDIFDVQGYQTGCGNPEKLAESKPAAKSAPAIEALLQAGAQFVGKTQTEELAFSMTGQNVHFPHPVNPKAPDRVTGGSSSGSAAAMAGGLADIATGSDTGGSIRVPASFCGLIGLRTTHGAISLDGTMPLAPSFDTFGWFARDMTTYQAVAKVLLPTAQAFELQRPLTMPVLDGLVVAACATEYRRMRGQITAVLGAAEIVSGPPQSLDELYWCLRRLQAHEAWAAHGEWITAKPRHMAQSTYDRFAFGQTVSDESVRTESARRAEFTQWFADLLGNDGFIVLPTVTDIAPRSNGSRQDFSIFREASIRLLCFSGLSGFPQLTLPLGTVDGAPFGISLLGPAGSDLALLTLGRRILDSIAKA